MRQRSDEYTALASSGTLGGSEQTLNRAFGYPCAPTHPADRIAFVKPVL